MPSPTFFSPYDQERALIERRRRMAEALIAQAQQPIDNPMAGGWVVPVQKSQGIAKLAQGLFGGVGQYQAGQQDQANAAAKSNAFAQALQGMPQPTTTTDWGGGTLDMSANPTTTTTQPTPQDYAKWMGQLAQVGPEATQVGNTMLAMQTRQQDRAEDREFRGEQSRLQRDALAQERQLAREARAAEIQQRLSDARITAQERAALQRELMQMQIWGRQDMMRMAASLRPPRQEPQPQVIQGINGPMILDRSGVARAITDDQGNVVQGKSTEKALPTSAAGKLMENQQNLRRAEQALSLISGQDIKNERGEPIARGAAGATGLQGYVPEVLLQRMDPTGVDTRAAIADLGSLIIHDRSGAAVTAAEFPRLRPFIPQVTDSPEAAKKKLTRFVEEYRKQVAETADFYKESGYKVPTETLRGSSGDQRQGADRRGSADRRAPPAPAGVDPALWSVMTPEERALWKQ